MPMTTPISLDELHSALRSESPALLVDVRRRQAYLAATDTLPGALRRDPETVASWTAQLPESARVIVYCAHGREVSQRAAQELERHGIEARYLEGGIEAWKAAGGALDAKPAGASSRWVTRERPKIDRIACPWLIARFVDPEAEFLYVPPAAVLAEARAKQAVPYDVPDVSFSHEGERCSFDAFLAHYRLRDPALLELAVIVRGADTGELELAPQAAGLLAISLGLSRLYRDDHEMLRQGMVLYDALYAWCKEGKDEVHAWNPDAYRAPSDSAT
ncbi:MAG: sulfurtransferase [Planctomycetes bacterium]|nr:sulfurtransferase [Planctomycetota bacterium]